MDCPVAAPYDRWDPILQRFVKPHAGSSYVEPAALRGSEAAHLSQPRQQLLSKFRTLSPPTQLASLRVSGTPSDATHNTPASGVAFGLGSGVETTTGAGAWWRSGIQHTSGCSSGVDSAERRLTAGAVRAVSFENDGAEPSPSTAGPDMDGADAAAEAAEAEAASHRLAMQLYEEEQHAFLSEYAERLTSPENPARRRASSIDPADLTPESMQMDDMDESERLAWQLQAEELQFSAYRPRREGPAPDS